MLTRVRDQPAVVVERAKSLLMTKDPATLPDFSSCEEFACFCKTGSQVTFACKVFSQQIEH